MSVPPAPVRELRTDPWSGRRTLVDDAGLEPAAVLAPSRTPPAVAPVPVAADRATEPAARARTDLLHAVAATETVEEFDVPPGAAAGEPGALADLLDAWRASLRAHAAAAFRQAALEVDADGAARSRVEAAPAVPALLARERERAGAHAVRTTGGVLGQELLQEEVKLRERVVAVGPEAVLLAAWAPRAAGQLTLVPRAARPRFEDDGPLGAASLAIGLAGLRALGAGAVRAWVRTAPLGAEEGWCWRIELAPVLPADPRETTTDVAVAALAPERLAAALRALPAV